MVWYAENPSGQIVAIKAQEACSVCVVGNGLPEWKCTPVDPNEPVDPVPPIGVLPPDSGGSGCVTDGGTGGSGGGTGGGETDILVETAKSIDRNSRMKFPNVSRETAIRTIRQWFLPRNVDAQPRAITGLGVDLFHVLSRIECSDITEKSSI